MSGLCEACQNPYPLDELQYVSDAPPPGHYETPERLPCEGCISAYLNEKWGEL